MKKLITIIFSLILLQGYTQTDTSRTIKIGLNLNTSLMILNLTKSIEVSMQVNRIEFNLGYDDYSKYYIFNPNLSPEYLGGFHTGITHHSKPNKIQFSVKFEYSYVRHSLGIIGKDDWGFAEKIAEYKITNHIISFAPGIKANIAKKTFINLALGAGIDFNSTNHYSGDKSQNNKFEGNRIYFVPAIKLGFGYYFHTF